MKTLLILLVGLTGCCHASTGSHERFVVDGHGSDAFTDCINGIEYIKIYGGNGGSAVTLSVDKNGEPIQCNY